MSFKINELNLDIPSQIKIAKVIDMMNDVGDYNWQVLNACLLEKGLNKIAIIHPPCIDVSLDLRIVIGDDMNGFFYWKSL